MVTELLSDTRPLQVGTHRHHARDGDKLLDGPVGVNYLDEPTQNTGVRRDADVVVT